MIKFVAKVKKTFGYLEYIDKKCRKNDNFMRKTVINYDYNGFIILLSDQNSKT